MLSEKQIVKQDARRKEEKLDSGNANGRKHTKRNAVLETSTNTSTCVKRYTLSLHKDVSSLSRETPERLSLNYLFMRLESLVVVEVYVMVQPIKTLLIYCAVIKEIIKHSCVYVSFLTASFTARKTANKSERAIVRK